MAKSITLNLDIKTKYQEQLGKIKSLNSQIAGAKGYEGHLGPERLNKVNALISSIEKTLDFDDISFEQLTELKNNFKELFNVLETVSNGVVTLTPKMKELKEAYAKTAAELDEAAKNRDEIVAKGKLSETGKSFVNIEGFNKKIEKLGAYRVKKDGTPYKKSLSDFETVKKLVDQYRKDPANHSPILTADGRDITETDEWKEMLKELHQYNYKLIQANKVLTEKTEAEQKALEAIKTQTELEKKEGISGVDITQGLTESKSDVGNITNTLYQKKAEQIGSDKTIDSLTHSINKQQTALGKAFRQFTIYNLVVRGLKTAVREAVQTISELDKSLTEQAMVTGMTREQAYGLVKSYQDLALQVGATTKEIASVATEYMKQGKTVEDSLKLTEAAVAAAKVARVSVGDSVNYLTTALNGFRLSAEDAMAVSDKFAAVAAASATDYDELAIALSKVASQANLAGMSIDYTTALLTKGLETTREAPETMGTALKTIIARMRELGNYGETLEGDTDINNVESQLKYVGIELRNTNGELRSTEDVLDQLGKKWDTLNTNQQAALAKALAGTRQQSRLIAMMDDYERVTELQEIAQRSAGATSAQAATYLEGIEASLNKVSVAWEKIVTGLVNSEWIIGGLEKVGNLLDGVGDFLSTTVGQVALVGVLGTAITGLISKKVIEHNIAKETLAVQNEELRLRLETRKLEIEEDNHNKKLLEQEKISTELAETRLKIATEKTKLKSIELKMAQNQEDIEQGLEPTYDVQQLDADFKKSQATVNSLSTSIDGLNQRYEGLDQKYKDQLQTNKEYQGILSNLTILETRYNSIMSANVHWLGLKNSLKLAGTAISKLVQAFQVKENFNTIKETILKKLETKAWNDNTKALIANTLARLGVVGAILAAIAAVGLLAAALITTFVDTRSESEKAAEEIKSLSNEIYKLNESSTAIKKAASEFDNLNNKIIKTKEDLEAMKESMNNVADSIDWTVGGKYSEEEAEAKKKEYSEMADPEAQRAYLEEIQKEIDTAIKDKREAQINKLGALSQAERNKLLEDDLAVLSAVRATNNAYLYEEIDELKKTSQLTDEQIAATEDLGQRILSNLSAQEAYNWATEEGRNNIKELVTQLEQLNVGEILTSNDYNLSEQIDAYKKAYKSLNEDARNALKEEFIALDTMARWDSTTIGLIEHLNLTADEVNDIAKAIQKLGFNADQSLQKFDALLKNINSSGKVQDSIMNIFGAQIGSLDTDEGKKLYNTILNAYAEATGVGILNMGQNLDKLNNTINDFYKKAAEWSTMSKAEQTQFLNDNAELFANNADLLEAFESGNYQAIEEALKNSDALQKQVSDRIAEIEQEIALEKAKLVEDQNVAYIQMLENELAYLNDTEELFEVSLETQLKQQEEQLNTYKEYLQEQKDALEDSLNKRKEAYEKYFDAINQNEEDEDYEEQANTLISNLSKLSSSTNADAKKQSKELENQLKELEEERLKTLRERAQEAVIENMDDTLDEINNKFDELINSNKALLAAMQGDLANGEGFLANLMTDKINDGATALELESFWKELESTYGSVLTGIDWDSFKASESGNSMFLNVNGQTIELSPGNQQSVYDVIMKALRQVGVS